MWGQPPSAVPRCMRLTFAFDGEDAILVDYQDYH
jgi:plasmid maintenance system killer protein